MSAQPDAGAVPWPKAFGRLQALAIPMGRIAASGRPWVLPEAPRDLTSLQLRAPGGATLDLPALLSATATDGLVVLKDGALVFETYANGASAHAPHILMSASKSVTAIVAGILHGAGVLDPAAPVAAYVPEVAGTQYATATVRQLLDMRTGMVLTPEQAQAYEAINAWPAESPAGLRDFFASLTTPGAAHGGPFSYISANSDLLGWVIARASGQSFAETASARLWRPLGAEDDAFITLAPDGMAQCTRGVAASARDLARLGLLVLQDGRRDGEQVIPAEWIADMIGGGDARAWDTGEWGRDFVQIGGPHMRYRSNWYVVDDAPPHIFAMGVHGQNLFVDRANGLVVAKVASQPERIDPRAMWLTHRLVDEIRATLAVEASSLGEGHL